MEAAWEASDGHARGHIHPGPATTTVVPGPQDWVLTPLRSTQLRAQMQYIRGVPTPRGALQIMWGCSYMQQALAPGGHSSTLRSLADWPPDLSPVTFLGEVGPRRRPLNAQTPSQDSRHGRAPLWLWCLLATRCALTGVRVLSCFEAIEVGEAGRAAARPIPRCIIRWKALKSTQLPAGWDLLGLEVVSGAFESLRMEDGDRMGINRQVLMEPCLYRAAPGHAPPLF
ncbi:hypothetical protein NDU88_004022 [Pleurodeles waltl]|uniref:Uncharacterized protein n=1 Tax=Pleurodeles waltl TaxID=8319 RepID=A0AAV7T8I3_PLEWA|nr:hypothetical protein NDU88_004022 [Pleurodeles waltl]